MKKKCALYSTVMFTLLLSACTSQQMYSTGQEYARQQCLKIPDPNASQQCLNKQDKSYDDYKRESDDPGK